MRIGLAITRLIKHYEDRGDELRAGFWRTKLPATGGVTPTTSPAKSTAAPDIPTTAPATPTTGRVKR
jgi:hypothetical protein